MNFKSVLLLLGLALLSSCLKTRAELGDSYKSQVYSKKQSDNQKDESVDIPAKIDEKDELIRNLNGRIESLENQIGQLQKEKNENTDAQKVQLLQESLVKMEAQLAKLEHDMTLRPSDEKVMPPVESAPPASVSKSGVGKTKKTSFDSAQEFFAQKDFKNAILEYQKFVETHPKSKLLPESKYKIGLCFEAMGLKDEAYSFYEEVAAQYGSTDFGKKAKQKITKPKKKK